MANIHRGGLSFEVDGKPYVLSYSVNALCELEDALGENVAAIATMMEQPDKLRLATVRILFWAGLLDNRPETTIADAGSLMTAVGLVPAVQLVGRAFLLAFPQAEASGPLAEPRKAPVRRHGIGRRS